MPPPSSEDNVWWDDPGTHRKQPVRPFDRLFINILPNSNSRLNRSPKRYLRRYRSGGGAVSVNKSIRLTGGLPVVVFPFAIRRRAVHSGSAGPVDSCSGHRTCNREEATSITFAGKKAIIGSYWGGIITLAVVHHVSRTKFMTELLTKIASIRRDKQT